MGFGYKHSFYNPVACMCLYRFSFRWIVSSNFRSLPLLSARQLNPSFTFTPLLIYSPYHHPSPTRMYSILSLLVMISRILGTSRLTCRISSITRSNSYRSVGARCCSPYRICGGVATHYDVCSEVLAGAVFGRCFDGADEQRGGCDGGREAHVEAGGRDLRNCTLLGDASSGYSCYVAQLRFCGGGFVGTGEEERRTC